MKKNVTFYLQGEIIGHLRLLMNHCSGVFAWGESTIVLGKKTCDFGAAETLKSSFRKYIIDGFHS